MTYTIAYDLGTGGTKAGLFDENGNSVAFAFIGCETFYPASGFNEQRPDDWWDSVVRSTRRLLEETHVCPSDVAALAVSGHSLGAVPISRDGELLSEFVPIWSDSRAEAEARAFFEKIDEESWYRDTGNGFPPPLYSIFKIMWIRSHQKDIYDRTATFIGTKDYINFRLTGVLATDRSYASGSGVYSLKRESYCDEYIQASGVDRDKLPEVLPSTAILGTILPDTAELLGLSPDTVVCAGGVDNACMALGAACIANGEAYTSLGTSAWIAVSSDTPVVSVKGHPYVFAHCVPGQYVSATCIFSAGNSFRWIKDILFDGDKREDIYQEMDRLASTSPAGSNGVLFVPTLAGGSGMDDSPHAKGCFAGLELRHTRADLIRSVLEGICLNLRMALDVLSDHVDIGENMLLVGGGGKSRFWRQLFADIYEKTILETNVGQDAGCLGAAAIAMVGKGIWKDFEAIRHACRLKNTVAPRPDQVDIYRKLMPIFAEVSSLQSVIGDRLQQEFLSKS